MSVNYGNISELINDVLRKIRPTKEEINKALELHEYLKEVIENELSIPYDFKVSLEGSLAKGTCLKGEIDLDIFILVKYKNINNEWIKSKLIIPLLKVLSKRGIRTELRYASHPYLRIYHNSYQADIVPAYWANNINEIKTPVDRTPFHTKYVLSKLEENQRDEVRLLKKFLKGIGVYGAEIKVRGFSGYLCELLIIKYGSFLNVLNNAKNWRKGEVIVIDSIPYTTRELRKIFRDSMLIVPDPVDPRRNAAAAVSYRSLATLAVASTLFLNYPDSSYFFRRSVKIPYTDLIQTYRRSKRNIVLILFNFINKTISPDVLWGKLLKLLSSLENLLRIYDVNLIDKSIWSDENEYALLMIEIPNLELPLYKVHRGPPHYLSNNIINFFLNNLGNEKIIGPWIDFEGHLKTLRRREETNVVNIIERILKQLMKGYKDYLSLSSIIELKDLSKIPSNILENKDFYSWISEVILKIPSWLPTSLTKLRSK